MVFYWQNLNGQNCYWYFIGVKCRQCPTLMSWLLLFSAKLLAVHSIKHHWWLGWEPFQPRCEEIHKKREKEIQMSKWRKSLRYLLINQQRGGQHCQGSGVGGYNWSIVYQAYFPYTSLTVKDPKKDWPTKISHRLINWEIENFHWLFLKYLPHFCVFSFLKHFSFMKF